MKNILIHFLFTLTYNLKPGLNVLNLLNVLENWRKTPRGSSISGSIITESSVLG